MISKPKFRMTPQRQILLEELCRKRWHPTADELYAVVREKMPRISLGTVYRNLEVLAEQGLIRKLDTGGHQKRFDGTAKPHYHVRCIRCNRLDDVTVDGQRDLLDSIDDAAGYAISGYLLEFVGICPKCQQHQLKEKVNEQLEGQQN